MPWVLCVPLMYLGPLVPFMLLVPLVPLVQLVQSVLLVPFGVRCSPRVVPYSPHNLGMLFSGVPVCFFALPLFGCFPRYPHSVNSALWLVLLLLLALLCFLVRLPVPLLLLLLLLLCS